MPLVMSILVGYDYRMNGMFSGKKALVVGGTGGIGRAISMALQGEGAEVLAVGGHPLDGTTFLRVDLDSPENCAIVCSKASEADIICCVRGPFLQKEVAATSVDEWNSVVYANLTLPGILVSAALPRMIERSWGRILLMGGTRTDRIRGFRTNAAYAAAKTGLSSLTRSVAHSYASHGITCNCICPGFVDTEYLDEATKTALAAKNPDGALISATEIAEAGIFLLSHPSCNGICLPMDKGWQPSFG